jgi:hypothetical protein
LRAARERAEIFSAVAKPCVQLGHAEAMLQVSAGQTT